MWIEEYRPKDLDSFAGNKKAIDDIKGWIDDFRNQKQKAILIIGPTGCGKTTVAELLARRMRYNIIEKNASDIRSKKMLKSFFGHALEQQSLFYKGKLVLLDEIEGISGIYDRGAPGEIKDLIKNSKHPIVMTATDESANPVKALKKISKVIRFDAIPLEEITGVLEDISQKAGLDIDERSIKMIARNAGGDIRAAINDLESLNIKGRKIDPKVARTLAYRDFEREVNESLSIIFKTSDCRIAKEAIDSSEADLDNMTEWIRDNIARQYDEPKDISESYNMLSRADLFRGRIRRQQYFRYMVYQANALSCGISTAKSRKYQKHQRFHFPTKIAILARTKFSRAKRDKNLKAIVETLHCSKNVARDYIPLLERIKDHQPVNYRQISEQIELNL